MVVVLSRACLSQLTRITEVLKGTDVVAELLGGQNELVATAAVAMAVRFRKLLIG